MAPNLWRRVALLLSVFPSVPNSVSTSSLNTKMILPKTFTGEYLLMQMIVMVILLISGKEFFVWPFLTELWAVVYLLTGAKLRERCCLVYTVNEYFN